MQRGLRDLRVVDLSTGIAGAYTSKLFADAGADVIKVEPPDGDPLRRWTASGTDLGDARRAALPFLHCSKRSVRRLAGRPRGPRAVAGADLVIDSFPSRPAYDDAALPRRPRPRRALDHAPGLAGREPTAGDASSPSRRSAARSAARGSPAGRRAGGRADHRVHRGRVRRRRRARRRPARPPDRARRARRRLAARGDGHRTRPLRRPEPGLSGQPRDRDARRWVELPSIEPTPDGWVGFNTNSRSMFNDFLVLIERPDLLDDEELTTFVGRVMRLTSGTTMVHSWTTAHDRRDRRAGLAAAHPRGAGQQRHDGARPPAPRARDVLRRRPDGHVRATPAPVHC